MTVLRYPGVYIEEVGGQPQSIPERPTSITAFVGYAANGPVDKPQRVASLGEFERLYAGSGESTDLDIAVRLFFANGGTDAWIVRLAGMPEAADDFGDEAFESGMYALASSEALVFNLLCLPDQWTLKPAVAAEVIGRAARFCETRFAFLLADVPREAATVDQALAWKKALDDYASPNGAVYFPALTVADPKRPGGIRAIGASGVMAGLYATTDSRLALWKAPMGPGTTLRAVQEPTLALSERDNMALNYESINPIAKFRDFGFGPWGARTIASAASPRDEWKYVPVRRLAIHVETSVREGLTWVGTESNNSALWMKIRRNVTTFLHTLYTMGAFMGAKPEQAYYVVCDQTNNPQAANHPETDAGQGICTVEFGFAPLKPEEFLTYTLRLKTADG